MKVAQDRNENKSACCFLCERPHHMKDPTKIYHQFQQHDCEHSGVGSAPKFMGSLLDGHHQNLGSIQPR